MTQSLEASSLLTLDAKVYRLSAVKKAAYRFAERCFIDISAPDDSRIEITLRPKSGQFDLAELQGEFRNELLDQELRELVAAETEGVRNLLLAQAFSALSVTDHSGETADYRDDPLGISQSQSARS